MLAAVFGPPELGKIPDPSDVAAYPRPDWYFLWLFAALALLPGQIAQEMPYFDNSGGI